MESVCTPTKSTPPPGVQEFPRFSTQKYQVKSNEVNHMESFFS